MAAILLVDDDLNTCAALQAGLSKDGHRILEAHSGKEALEKVRSQDLDLAIIDLRMPGMDGMEFFQTLKALRPEVMGIMISGQPTVDLAVNAIKSGIYDFITKPFRLSDIKKAIARALEAQSLVMENRRLRQALQEKASFTEIIGKSPAFVGVLDLVSKIAPTRSTVLLTGESGTGKEIIAEAIHYASPRYERPLIKINCGALTETLLESELFGHEKGAFTGAYQQRMGRFESGNGGTIFLDEIGEMSLGMQVKLLRVLQDGSFERVGSSRTIQVDVRIIAATNRQLEDEVKAGRFRQDLFYRLNVISIEIPPLRERMEDIPLLAGYFLNRYTELNQKNIKGFSPEVSRVLNGYDWPGNVRELENVVERAVSLCQTATIELADLPVRLQASPTVSDQITLPIGLSLEEVERQVIEKTLIKVKGDKKTAARILGISLSSLYNKLAREELKDPHPAEAERSA
ncbi:MAG: sigma-54-dependent Fis family transcriptional regulator [Deltaproteobacteria bacterium]|nr:sigma-54-dependent Fis family transcriptional regulator [Deltaproteobacteria bacterium]